MVSEYITHAIVLDKEPLNETDARVFLYTQELGRITAKIISARKIISKLNGHLEPLNLVWIRLIKKNIFQVADALKVGALSQNNLAVLRLIKELTADSQPDLELWSLIQRNELTEEKVLRILGFDKQFATCQLCGSSQQLFFSITDLVYFCQNCKMTSR